MVVAELLKELWGGQRIANDNNPYLIELFKQLQIGWIPPQNVSVEDYYEVRELYKTRVVSDLSSEDMALIAFVATCCSFGGKWFGGYARANKGVNRGYAAEGHRTLLAQKQLLGGVQFCSMDYQDVPIKKGSVVYCDIPYKNTTNGYYDKHFDHERFYEWVEAHKKDYDIYISEYLRNGSPRYPIVWEKQSKTDLKGVNNKKLDTCEILMHAE